MSFKDTEGADNADISATEKQEYGLSKDIDILSQPFSWNQFTTLIDSVKKQSESVISNAKKDIYMFSNFLSKEINDLKEVISSNNIFDEKTKESSENKKNIDINEEKKDENIFYSLKNSTLFNQNNPLKSIRQTETYLNKLGIHIGDFLKEIIEITPPNTDISERNIEPYEKKPFHKKREIYLNRKDYALHLLHSEIKDIMNNISDSTEEFKEWDQKFFISQKIQDIEKLLETYPDLKISMEEMIQNELSYEDFWKKYFWLRQKLEIEEDKRKKLLENTDIKDNEILKWDEDDDYNNEEKLSILKPLSKLTLEKELNTNDTDTFKQEDTKYFNNKTILETDNKNNEDNYDAWE
ncbi:uncharacterized protein T551_03057 [Pneumocystis jirovecii RU7]|uniref:BSD domain-containing protein n=1 Tax=Pneumocystis jirovecii (strain RU7) TaxID=1408657 RepID=A0A0W4ZGQ7_PNEJ7|nr:uncharacterized protein T551_03057 [Pneumocystis jirovecii RU7]KTW27558.1 hypothetical protein T551_03057 [Pneumocystis jirovecii RU7]